MSQNDPPVRGLAALPSVQRLIDLALDEDLGRGDVTTASTVGRDAAPATANMVARAPLTVFGLDVAAAVFAKVDARVILERKAHDGDRVQKGALLLVARGPAGSLLEAERTALNFLTHLSGVATLTARYVAAVAGTSAKIVDTRKTTPGLRLLEKAAVRHGGGTNHRIGLWDEVLLKENHFAMGGPDHARLVARVKSAAPPGTRITAEARTPEEAWAAADGGADTILLDNFTTAALAQCVAKLAAHPRRTAFLLEASGGVNLETVGAIAHTGVDRISIGALTHSAPALDLSMLLDERAAPP